MGDMFFPGTIPSVEIKQNGIHPDPGKIRFLISFSFGSDYDVQGV